jgi:hypothetical protein
MRLMERIQQFARPTELRFEFDEPFLAPLTPGRVVKTFSRHTLRKALASSRCFLWNPLNIDKRYPRIVRESPRIRGFVVI